MGVCGRGMKGSEVGANVYVKGVDVCGEGN